MTVKSAKRMAKETLKGKWHKVILVFAVVAAAFCVKLTLSTVFNYIFIFEQSSASSNWIATFGNALIIAIELLGFVPLYMGAFRWLWNMLSGADEPMSTLFFYYDNLSDYKKSISLGFNFMLRILLWSIAALIPFVFFMALCLASSSYESNFGMVTVIIVFFLTVLSAVFGIIFIIAKLCKYILAIPMIFADENLSVKDVFYLSKRIIKGKRAGLMLLVISFVGWLLLCLLAIPMIWVLPYFATSVLAYLRNIITEIEQQNMMKNEQIEQI